ncbi:MAG: amidohydrolase family protein [Spirochaetia bacterium]
MNEDNGIWCSRVSEEFGIMDNHVHMASIKGGGENSLLSVMRETGIEKMCLLAVQKPASGSGMPEALYMKSKHPCSFYLFAGLSHAGDSGADIPSPEKQIIQFAEMGCDGMKMFESKPDSRRWLNVPVTDPYYAGYWDVLEKSGIPVVWHVADPEEFWDPVRIPGWAKKQGWGYGPDDPSKESLYREAETILHRYPGLTVIFAHLYFTSADLSRAARFLDDHSNVYLDLAPGIEMLYNISRNPPAGKDFFSKYSDRIIFGTDISSACSPEESFIRAGIIFRWLETEDEFRVPPEADFLLGPPEAGLIRGMNLKKDVLRRIYRDNLLGILGPEPQDLDIDRAKDCCSRIAAEAESISGVPAGDTEAAWIGGQLK